jgi:type II secretory pathway component PulF
VWNKTIQALREENKMDAFGSTFDTDLTAKITAIGATVAPYIVLVLGLVLGVVVIGFIVKFIRAHISR